MLSYKELIKANQTFADNHYVIQNFGAGERWQVTQHDQTASFKYPLMFMEDTPQPYSKGEYVYSFRIWFVTRVESPKDRGDDILFQEYTNAKNDMIICAQNLISHWVQDIDYPELDISTSGSVETFTEETPDRITGCWLDVQFKVNFNYDKCLIPSDDNTI